MKQRSRPAAEQVCVCVCVCVALSLAVEQHISQQRHLSGGHEERAARRSRQRAKTETDRQRNADPSLLESGRPEGASEIETLPLALAGPPRQTHAPLTPCID